jgi:transposase
MALRVDASSRPPIICDNARYYRSQLINDYLNDSKIKLVFLPPHAPNLNLIERYWKFFKKKILYGRYYETFSLFKSTCEAFFTSSVAPECRNFMCDGYKCALEVLVISPPP